VSSKSRFLISINVLGYSECLSVFVVLCSLIKVYQEYRTLRENLMCKIESSLICSV
jgi:hypothetical protein